MMSVRVGVVDSRFRIMAGQKKAASGTTQSTLPCEDLET
jgi:hypothetical protein